MNANTSFKNKLIKGLKIVGITIASLLLLLYLIPLIFPGTIAAEVKKIANNSLDSKMEFSKSKLSFFTHFPYLTVSLDHLSLSGSAPFRNSTFIKANQVAFGISLEKLLFNNEIKIDKLYISDASLNVLVNEKGQANYNIYVAPKKDNSKNNEEGTAIRLQRIDIKNCQVNYNDLSLHTRINAKGLNYVGKGNLSDVIFDLNTFATADAVDLYYKNIPYLKKKKLKANLVTRINTHALSFILQKNELLVNKLPLKFTGFLTLLKEGYKININAASEKTTLKDLLTVLPPENLSWLDNVTLNGSSDLLFTLKGRYNTAKNLRPDLAFNIKVHDASLKYKNAVIPVTNFKMNLNASLPSLDTEKLMINLTSLTFKLGDKDYFKAFFQSKGFTEMTVNTAVKGSLDLATLGKAVGLKTIAMQGSLKTNITANGIYNASKKLFPKTKGGVRLTDGQLKTTGYPNPITQITFVADLLNTTGTFKDLKVAIKPASFVFEGNPVYAYIALSDFNDLFYEERLEGELNIGNIYKVFSKKNLSISGYAKANLLFKGRQSYATSGKYNKLENKGTLVLQNVKAKSSLFPKTFFIKEGNFRFQNEKMWFEKFNASYGQSDFDINGYLLNTFNYFLESKGVLSGNFNMKSKRINVDEFMSLKKGDLENQNTEIAATKQKHPKMSGVVIVPTNLNVGLTLTADKIEYNQLQLDNLSGKVGINQGQIYLEKILFNIIDCRVGIDAVYDDESPITANFKSHITAENFNVHRAYTEIPMFHKMVTAAEKAQGIISLDYKINGDFDGNMAPIYASLKGDGTVYLRDVKIKGLNLFEGISTKTGQSGLNNPNMAGIEICTTIDHNLIHINNFSFMIAGFKPRIKGTSSFDGLLDLRMRLGLPPFGIIGIPFTITGTYENPVIKAFSKTGKEIAGAIYNEKTNTVIKKEKVVE